MKENVPSDWKALSETVAQPGVIARDSPKFPSSGFESKGVFFGSSGANLIGSYWNSTLEDVPFKASLVGLNPSLRGA